MTRSSTYLPILLGATTLAVAAIFQQQQRSQRKSQGDSADGNISREVSTTTTPSPPTRLTLEDKANLVVVAAAGKDNQEDQHHEQQESVSFSFHPIGTVHSVYRLCVGTPRQGLLAPHARGQIELTALPLDAVAGLEGFSHIWVIFCFHLNTLPKNESKQPSKVAPPALGGVKVGVLATRSPHRPNPIGMTLCKLDRIRTPKIKNQLVTILDVSGLDLVDGTPVLDIKPFVPHYDTSDGIMGHNTTLPSWVVDGLETRRKVTVSTLAKHQLLAILQQNPKALSFYGPHRGDLSEDETLHQVTKCIEEILSIDVRSSWQTQKARKGKSQAERANRVKEIMVGDENHGEPSTSHPTNNNDHHLEEEEDICTQQIDNLLLHFTVVEQLIEQQRTTSKGSGAEDSVHVKSIRFLGSKVEDDDVAEVTANVNPTHENHSNKELDISLTLEAPLIADTGVPLPEVNRAVEPVAVDKNKPLIDPAAKYDPEQIEDASYRRLKSYWSKQASQNTPTGVVPANPIQNVASKEKFFVFSDKPIRVKVGMEATTSGPKSPARNTISRSVTPPISNRSTDNKKVAAVEPQPETTTCELVEDKRKVESEIKLEEDSTQAVEKPTTVNTSAKSAQPEESNTSASSFPTSDSHDNKQSSEKIESSDAEDLATSKAEDEASPPTTENVESAMKPVTDAAESIQAAQVLAGETKIHGLSESAENTITTVDELNPPAETENINAGQPPNETSKTSEQPTDESSSLNGQDVIQATTHEKDDTVTSEQPADSVKDVSIVNSSDEADDSELSTAKQNLEGSLPPDQRGAAADDVSPIEVQNEEAATVTLTKVGIPQSEGCDAAAPQTDEVKNVSVPESTNTTITRELSAPNVSSSLNGQNVIDAASENKDDTATVTVAGEQPADTVKDVSVVNASDEAINSKLSSASSPPDQRGAAADDISPLEVQSDGAATDTKGNTGTPQTGGSDAAAPQTQAERTIDATETEDLQEEPIDSETTEEPAETAIDAKGAEAQEESKTTGFTKSDIALESALVNEDANNLDVVAKENGDAPLEDLDKNGVATSVDETATNKVDARNVPKDTALEDNGAEISVFSQTDTGAAHDLQQNKDGEETVSTQTSASEPSQPVVAAPDGTTSTHEADATIAEDTTAPTQNPGSDDAPLVESVPSDAEVKEESVDHVLVSASEDTTDHDEEDAPLDAAGSPALSSNSQAKKRRKRKKNKK